MSAEQSPLISRIEEFVKQEMAGNDASHDWSHVQRVRKLALRIADCSPEVKDRELVELAALLHDVSDYKYAGVSDGDSSTETPYDRMVRILREFQYPEDKIEELQYMLDHVSFHSEIKGDTPRVTPELAAVQDADRLDAMGAIGVARCLAYTGRKGHAFYDPAFEENPRAFENKCVETHGDKMVDAAHYVSAERKQNMLEHFFEKLFKLKTLLKTAEGRKLGEERHSFMVQFVEGFLSEWEVTNETSGVVEVA